MDRPESQLSAAPASATTSPTRKSLKRKLVQPISTAEAAASTSGSADPGGTAEGAGTAELGEPSSSPTTAKKSRTNTPWTPAEERRLKTMRDAGNSWSEIAKVGIVHISYLHLAEEMADLPESDRRECEEALVQGNYSTFESL